MKLIMKLQQGEGSVSVTIKDINLINKDILWQAFKTMKFEYMNASVKDINLPQDKQGRYITNGDVIPPITYNVTRQ